MQSDLTQEMKEVILEVTVCGGVGWILTTLTCRCLARFWKVNLKNFVSMNVRAYSEVVCNSGHFLRCFKAYYLKILSEFPNTNFSFSKFAIFEEKLTSQRL